MFRRVVTESWHDWAPYAGFAITFAVFMLAFIRALLLRKERVEKIARLPLDENDSAAENPSRNPSRHLSQP